MRKKFTLLFTLLLAFVGVAKADVAYDGVYTIGVDADIQRGYVAAGEGYADYPVLSGITLNGYTQNDTKAIENGKNWYITSVDEGVSYYIYNVAVGKFLVGTGSQVNFGEEPYAWSIVANGSYVNIIDVAHPTQALSGGCGRAAANRPVAYDTNKNDGGAKHTITAVAGGATTFATQIAAAEAAIAKLNSVVKTVADLSNSKVYTVTANDNRGSWVYSAEKNALTSTTKAGVDVNAEDANQQFAFITVKGMVYLYSVGASKFVVKKDGATTVVDDPEAYVTFLSSNVADYPIVVALNGENHVGVSNGYDPAVITSWNDINDKGNQSKIVAVAEKDLSSVVSAIELYLNKEAQELIAAAEALYNGHKELGYSEITDLGAALEAVKEAFTDENIEALEVAYNVAKEYPFLESTVKTIEPDNYYIYYTDESGVKHYLQTAGNNSIVTVTEGAKAYAVSAGVTNGGKFSKAYYMEMNNLRISNTNSNGTQIETKALNQSTEWTSQVVFEKDGKCAIRLTNATAMDQWHGYFFIGKGETEGTTIALDPATSLEEAMFIWTFEKKVTETLSYTLTDALGNTYTGTYEGAAGEDVPVLSGVAGYTLSNGAWNGTAYTANIAFPFPISNAETTNATMISNFNAGQRWHAVGDDVKVQTAQPTNATKGEWLWAIYPKFENGAFTFTVKNVGNGKFVTLNKDASSFDTQGTVTLTENGTALEVINWLGAPCFKVPGKTLYLTINGSADADVYLATWTGGNNNHGGNKLHFTEFVDVTGVTLDKTEATLTEAGATVTLVATVAPENAADKTVTWSTSDDKVATVVDGVVTAVANGKATITAKAGEKTATCEVTVAIPEVDPNDYTSYIKNAAVTSLNEWTVEGNDISHGDGLVKLKSNFDFNQTITLPAGKYKMTVKAAYRYAGGSVNVAEKAEYDAIQAGVNTHLAKVYAQTATYKYEGDVQNRWEGRSETDLYGDLEKVSVIEHEGVTYYVPNSSAAVMAWFNADKYVNELVFNVQAEGEVKIGMNKTETAPNGEYTNISAWTLTRLGDAEADPEVEEPTPDPTPDPEDPETPSEPAVWAPSEVGNGVFYLYNVGAQKYLCSGNAWGSQASVAVGGVPMTLAGEGEVYTISSVAIYKDGFLGLDGSKNPFMDCGATNWTFEAVAENVYKIKIDDKVLFWPGEGNAHINYGDDPNTEASQWMLYTEGARIAHMADATAENPMDVTFLIKNAYFAVGNGRWVAKDADLTNSPSWKGTPMTDLWGINTWVGNEANYSVEQYGKEFDNYQELKNIPNGLYHLTAKGFYRGNVAPYIYANDKKCELKVKGDIGGDNIGNAAKAMIGNDYLLEGVDVIVENGELRVGVKSDEQIEWCVFDDFSLTYYGEVKEEEPFTTEIVGVTPAEGEVTELSEIIVQFSDDKILPYSNVYLMDAIENVYEFELDANHSDYTQARYVAKGGAITAAGTYVLDCSQIDHMDMMTGKTINPFEGTFTWVIKAAEVGFGTEIVGVTPAEGEVTELSEIIVQFSNDKILPYSNVFLVDAIENVYEFELDANHSDYTQARYVAKGGAITAAGTYVLDCSQIDHMDMMTGKTINPFEGTFTWTIKAVVDGIQNINADADAVIYDIHGRRVTEMTKGIYIVNGVKVIKK